ncbi:Chitosanase-domain-containing protein, partial [Dendrothele bispora CBS 962.96]
MVTVYTDLMDRDDTTIRAMSFMADMDVDCDGAEPNDPSGQGQTTWGYLNADQVPFYVLPQSLVFDETDGEFVQPNSLGAIICGGKMFYAIMGDTNGDDVEHIGEASILLAQTCFPNDNLGGNNGHTSLDVAYIVFGDAVLPGDNQMTIDIQALKDLGDRTVREFQ